MKNLNILVLLIQFSAICFSCNENIIEKNQKKRDKTININDKINDIKIDSIFGFPMLYILDDFLIISDLQPHSAKAIHLFNKNTFEHITSTGILGKGPGEIIRPGSIGIDHKNNIFWVADHGKKLRWKFYLDSVLQNDLYKPTESLKINYDLFMERYGFLNDSVVLGIAVKILPDHSFVKAMTKLNLHSNNIELYGYEHPEAVKKKSSSDFKISLEYNFYVNCYYYCDLMTICDLNGQLKYNVYGPGWMKNKNNKNNYFFGVDIIGKHIIASYLGDVGMIIDEYNRQKGNLPSRFLIFDLEGNFLKTFETGFKIHTFCIDEENRRVLIYFDDRENPLGYFDLNFD